MQNAIRQQEDPEPESDDPRRAEIISDLETAVKRGGIDDMRFVWQALQKDEREMVGQAELARIKKLAPSDAVA